MEKDFPLEKEIRFMENNRTSRRVRVNLMVAYCDDNRASRMGSVRDISMEGMYIHTGIRPVVHDHISASINMENLGKVIWITGRIVRMTDTGMAVMFTTADNKGLASIMSYWHASR